MKKCTQCQATKKNKEFYKGHNRCKVCVKAYQNDYNLRKREATLPMKDHVVKQDVPTTLTNPRELCMKRMLSGAKSRAKDKGVDFNIDYSDIQMPNLCPVLKIPLVPNEGSVGDSSPTLDRLLPHLGYTKGNVKVISSLANRIKTNATSAQIFAVAEYTRLIEEENI
tara:strand:+ start:1587 stop:2087 length:501 start_codon:yes stop_codon:yes gene_type:complete